MVPAAFGTQTGGSVLRPAAYCGVVGYKPTFNLINRAGIKFAAETLDTIGLHRHARSTMSSSITAVLIGKDACATARSRDAPRLGLCRTPLWDTAQPETKQAVEDAAKRLAAAGASVREITLPEEFSRLYHASRETINNYERSKIDGRRLGEPRRRASARCWATASSSAWRCKHEDYVAALRLAEHCRALIEEAFDGIDAIIAPCVKGEAPPGLEQTGDPAFQQFWTVLYVPAMSLPTHRGPNGPAGRHPAGRAALRGRPPVRLRALDLAAARAGVRIIHGVVPAQAGTHNHSR